jgi:TolB-like protein
MKPLFLTVFLFLIQCASTNRNVYANLAEELSSRNESKTVAVLPFEVNSKEINPTLVVERLTHELVRLKNYQIIERNKIDRVLKEQSMTQTGITSKDDSMRIGKLVSAEGVVVGTVIREGQYTTILARIVDTETGKIWSSSKVSYLTEGVSNAKPISPNAKPDSDLKPIESLEKPKGEVKDLQLIRSGNFGRFIGLLKNTGSIAFSGNKLFINLKDKKNSFLDTVQCFTDKPVYPQEEVSFNCILSNFPSEYGSHEIFFEPESRFYGNFTPFKIVSEKFKEESSGLEGFSLTGILKNDTEYNITYPKIVLSLFDQNKKFVGSAIGFANQSKLAPGETSSFKVSAYSYALGGKAKSYKVQTHALIAATVQ